MKDRLLESLTIILPLTEINKTLVNTFESMIISDKNSKAKLFFEVINPVTNQTIKLYSRSKNITINKELISNIEKFENVSYKINDKILN